MDKKKALGRGMASLIPGASVQDDSAPPPRTYFYCDIENMVPNEKQPRKFFQEEALQELSDSIREKGILQPIMVRRLSEFKYEIIAGERRWRAAQKAGFKQVPVIIRETTAVDALEDALIENIQREDLNAIEEAQAYEKLIEEHAYTQDQLAKKLGKQRSTIANCLRLLALSKAIQNLIVERKISAGHARALLMIEDPERQNEIAQKIIISGLSVRQVEQLAKDPSPSAISHTETKKDEYVLLLEEELSQHFKAKVKIHHRNKRGKIEIEYFGEEELNRIVALLKA